MIGRGEDLRGDRAGRRARLAILHNERAAFLARAHDFNQESAGRAAPEKDADHDFTRKVDRRAKPLACVQVPKDCPLVG